MFWVLLAIAVFIAGIVFAIYERDWVSILSGFGLSLAVLFVGLIFFIIGLALSPDELYSKSNTQICAMSDNVGVKFSCYLGGGQGESKMYYYYLSESDDGSKMMHEIESDKATVYEDEIEHPYVVTIEKRFSNPVMRFFFSTMTTCYEVHIPPNSIKYDYSIDLQ